MSGSIEFIGFRDLYEKEPSEMQRNRDEINEEFLRVMNIVQPEHPEFDDPYPLCHDDIKYSWCRSDSKYIAKCGPRYAENKVFFAADKHKLGRASREYLYNTLVHESTHVSQSMTRYGAHKPSFWESFTDNILHLINSNEIHGINEQNLLSFARNDPTTGTVDRRMRTVKEQREEIEDMIRESLSATQA